MPVRLAEIPNAPQYTGAPVTSRGPGAAPDISTAARQNLLQSTVDINSLGAPARAMQAVGRAITDAPKQVVGAINDFIDRKSRIQDLTTEAELDNALSEMHTEVTNKNSTLPGDKWLPTYESTRTSWNKRLSDIVRTASPDTQARMQAYLVKADADSRSRFSIEGTKKALSDGRDSMDVANERDFQNGNFDEVFSRLNRMHKDGVITDAERDSRKFQFQERNRVNSLYSAMGQNPKAFYEDTKEYVSTGKSEILEGSIKSPEEAKVWASRAKANWEGIQTEARQSLFQDIQSGAITREDEILDRAKASNEALDAKDIQAARKALMNQVGPLDPVKYADLRTRVAAVGPNTDKSEIADLQRAIGADLPSQEGAILNRQLMGLMKSKTPNQEVDSFVKSNLKTLHEDQFFGKWKNGTGEKKQIDRPAEQKSALEMSRLMDGWETYQRANPGANYEDAQNWINTQTAPMRESKRASWFQFADPANVLIAPRAILHLFDSQKPSPPNPNEALKKMGEPKQSSPSASTEGFTKGLATTFGYKDPEDNGVGAWGHKTNDPNIMGASLPIAMLRDHFGDENLAKGKMVEVRNPENGKTIKVPIVDKGPAAWVVERQGPTVDLTHAASKAIGATGKTPVEFRILG